MKKIIFKKLLNEILFFFILSSCSLTLIIWVIQAVNFLDFVSEDGHSFKVYFLYTLLIIPKLFAKILPFVFFFSVFYIISSYEDKNQLLIYWTHGISKKKFLNAIIKFSFLFVLFQILLSTFLVPVSSDKARSFIRNSNLDFFPSLIKPQKFVDTVENLTIFVDSKDKNGFIQNIVLKDKINSTSSQIILAKNGNITQIDNKKVLILNDGKIINSNNDGHSTTFNFKKTQFDLSKYSTKTTTFPKIQELESYKLFICGQSLIDNNIPIKEFDNLNCEKSLLDNIIQELLKRIYLPFYIPLITLIATFSILKSRDTSGYQKFKFKLFILGILFLFISEVSIKYAGINNFYNIIFLCIPIVSFFIIYKIFTFNLGLKK